MESPKRPTCSAAAPANDQVSDGASTGSQDSTHAVGGSDVALAKFFRRSRLEVEVPPLDHGAGGQAAIGPGDELGAAVSWVGSALQVAELLQFSQQQAHRPVAPTLAEV